MKKTVLIKLALAGLLATGLTTTAWAMSNNAKSMYRMPNGKLTNVFPARKASAAKPKTTPAAKSSAPKPRKKVNFTLKKK